MFAATALIDGLKAFSRAAIGAFSAVIDKSLELEQINTRFEILTGSIESAATLLKDLQDFAATTPFQLPGLANAAAQLLSFGFVQEEIIDRLKVLGDVAAGSGSDIKEITLIFGQVAAAGKLTGERLLQLQERAIPIGPALAKTLGVAESAVRDLVSKGVVDFDTFARSFQTLTGEGGKFFQATIKQSKTLGGVLSTLSDNFDLLLTDVGEGILPAFKVFGTAITQLIQDNRAFITSISADALRSFGQAVINIAESASDLADFIRENTQNIKDFAIALGVGATAALGLSLLLKANAAAAAINTVAIVANETAIAAAAAANIALTGTTIATTAVTKLSTGAFVLQAIATNAATFATKALSLALALTPYGLIIIAVGALAFGIKKLVDNFDFVAGSIKVFTASILESMVPALEVALKGIGFVVGIFNQDLAVAIESSIQNIKNLSKELRVAGEDQIAVSRQLSEEDIARIASDENRKFTLREDGRNKDKKAEQEKLTFLQGIEEVERLRKQEQALNDKIARQEATQEDFLALQSNQAEQAAVLEGFKNQERDIIKKSLGERAKLVKKQQEEEKKGLLSLFDFEKNTNAGRAANFKSTLGTISTLSKSKNKELAFVGKAAAIGTATLDGIVAVQKALASAPPPFNFVLAGLVGTATALNIAKIASTSVGGFQGGGIVGGTSFTGDRLQANVNSGELILNRAQQSNVASQLNESEGVQGQILEAIRGLSNQTTVIEVDGREIARTVRDQERAGFAFA